MPALQASYDVGGIAYPRPFKIRRLGHFGFNVADMPGGIDFYSRLLGFRITDERDLSRRSPAARRWRRDSKIRASSS